MKTALITGITGQDGAYLAQLLLDKGYRVLGTIRSNAQDSLWRLEKLGVLHQIELRHANLTDANSIVRVIRDNPCDEFYNLAASSYVGASWDTPLETCETNGMGVVHILDALRTYAPQTRFYQASTSEMFGLVREVPQKESTPFHPRSPYGFAKAFAHMAVVNYRESFGMHATSGILFNHESPLRGTNFVTRKITLGLARLAHGVTEPLRLGNLNAERDWGFAGDYVEGMWRMLQQEEPEDFVLATGQSHTIREFASLAADAIGMPLTFSGDGLDEVGRCTKTGRILVQIDQAFYRPSEVAHLQGDARKAKEVLGWTPKTTLEELVTMMAHADLPNSACTRPTTG